MDGREGVLHHELAQVLRRCAGNRYGIGDHVNALSAFDSVSMCLRHHELFEDGTSSSEDFYGPAHLRWCVYESDFRESCQHSSHRAILSTSEPYNFLRIAVMQLCPSGNIVNTAVMSLSQHGSHTTSSAPSHESWSTSIAVIQLCEYCIA
mmetsp:Transcript_19753/g.49325  ORF Transcript_19753/g.49325 Transcript_19753/m.49325 type:complete len:150 (+) Transcript_19753:91-540(+)